MTEPEVFLKTQQVADALGISVSTLKRWVDAGQLAATRTVGRHRLIALDEAIRFAREREFSMAGLRRLADDGAQALVRVDDAARGALAEALKVGRAREARRLIRSAHAALGDGAALADELIGPVMREVGHGWSVGDWDVFEEHQASQIVATALNDLIARATRGGDMPSPVALGASPEGDSYTLPTLLGELTLREIGWDVRNLGPDLPLKSLARAVEAHRPRLVFLAVMHVADPIGLVGEYAEFARSARAVGTAIVLGGLGLTPGLRSRLDHDGFGGQMADLAAIGRRLLPAARPAGHANHDDPGATDRPGPGTSREG
jgi:excisionase family DNA binding protein